MQLTVTLKPHVGYQDTELGRVEVEHDQWMVFAQGEEGPPIQMGYVGKQAGRPFNGFENYTKLPEVMRVEIERQLNEQLGDKRRVFMQPVISPAEIAQLTQQSDGDEDDAGEDDPTELVDDE